MSTCKITGAKSVYFAQPYNPDAQGFFFETYEAYANQSRVLKDSFGQPVEEFELQFIDGANHALFKALGVNQATLPNWFDIWEDFCPSEDRYHIAIYLAENSYDGDELLARLEDFHLFHGTAQQYAEELIDECYELSEFALRYFDYQAFAHDLIVGGDITELDHNRLIIGPL